MPALFHPNRFQKELESMTEPELIELAAQTRRKSDSAAVGTTCQIVAAIPSQGTSLLGMVYTVPRWFYFAIKKRMIKKELESRGLRLNRRTKRDYIVPTVVGGVTLALGSGADAIGHLSGGAAEQAQAGVNGGEWIERAFHSGLETTYNHVKAIFHPEEAGELAQAEYANAYGGDVDEQVQDGFDRFGQFVDTVMPGGTPLLSGGTADVVGGTVAATVIGELVGKGVEACLPGATGSAGKRRQR